LFSAGFSERAGSFEGTDLRELCPWFDDELNSFFTGDGESVSFEKNVEFGGEQRCFNVILTRFENDTGKSSGIFICLEDITARKEAEEILTKSEFEYRAILDKMLNGVYKTNLDGDYVYANERLAQIFGYDSVDELFQDGIVARYKNIEDRELLLDILKKDGSVERFELDIVTKGGETKNIVLNAIMDGDNISGMMLDITDLRKFREELQNALGEAERQRANWQAIFRIAPIGMLLLDENLRIIQLNDVVERMFSRGSEDILGELPGDGFGCINSIDDPGGCGSGPACESCEIRGALQNVFNSGQPVYDKEIRKSFFIDGVEKSIWLSISAEPIIIDGREHMLFTMDDVTLRKNAEQMKNDFVGVVSHELRTPLTSIMGSLGLLSAGSMGKLSGEALDLVDIAYRNGERLLDLINDILDIEKMESGKLIFDTRPIDLLVLVRQSIEDNYAYAQKYDVDFELLDGPDSVEVEVDPERLLQVITNLLANAAKYSDSGKAVGVKVSKVEGFARVGISNEGSVISEELRDKIFEKFAQGDSSDSRKKGGTGLGLAISKMIVEKHGGRIGFESDENAGTTFYFDLPLIE